MRNIAREWLRSLAAVFFAFALGASGAAPDDEGQQFVPLFNGQNLDGWVNVNCAPETFSVREAMIVSTGKPTGVLRTEKQYENFILELEWKHIEPTGNAGLFVWSDAITSRGVPFTRSIEVQILDGRNSETYTSHGDVFAIHGATFVPDRPHPKGAMRCLPSEHRCRPAGEWNHYRVVCRDGDIELAVNGKVVSGGHDAVPRKGYICLESEGTECHFRNIRICELPAGNATPEQTAAVEQGFQSLYSGVDLRGWETQSTGWQAKDWTLEWNGEQVLEDAPVRTIVSQQEFPKGTLICDWRWSAADDQNQDQNQRASSLHFHSLSMDLTSYPADTWHRIEVTFAGTTRIVVDGEEIRNEPSSEADAAAPISILPGAVSLQIANLYFRAAGE